jgi:hypothetical protein
MANMETLTSEQEEESSCWIAESERERLLVDEYKLGDVIGRYVYFYYLKKKKKKMKILIFKTSLFLICVIVI